jgi:antitoxin MazE
MNVNLAGTLLTQFAPCTNVDTLYLHRKIMRAVVKKWGNSASVRIPAGLLQAARLELDAVVEVREEGGRIVIEPIRPTEFDIDQLLAGITPKNLHAEVDFGIPLRKELL